MNISDKTALIVGYGDMGKKYLPILLDLGFLPAHITIVDTAVSKLDECRAQHPHVQTTAKLADALRAQPWLMFTLTNSPAHWPVLQAGLRAGVKNHFVEKPLVARASELDALRVLVTDDVRLGVGYLLNFSEAVERLLSFCAKTNVVVQEIRGTWGKNRLSDPAPTFGNLDDEATHLIGLANRLLRHAQPVQTMSVRATLSFLPFVQRPESAEVPYPASPNSTSQVALLARTMQQTTILAALTSSYIASQQKRSVELTLGPSDHSAITHLAQINFDAAQNNATEDVLWLYEAKNTLPEPMRFPALHKLETQVAAFVEYLLTGTADPRLTLFDEADLIVRITKAATESDRQGRAIIVS